MREGWELKSLGDICDISTGKSNTEDAIENGEYAFFDRSKIIKKSSKYLFDCDAIIVAGEGQTFFPKFFSGKFDLHQRAYALYNFQESVSVKYAFKYLIHFHKYFESVAVGATAKSLRLRHFQELPIPLPPLPEQQRIVAILDECFAALEKAKANAEQNLKNAKELFESYLQGVFENKGEGWEEKTLAQISKTFGRGKSKHRPRNWEGLYGGEYPFIQTGDIRNCNHFVTEYSQTYNDVGLAQSKLWKSGTICITIAANIAETGILTFDACFPDSVIGIEVNEKYADRDFVEYLLQSFKVRIQALGKGSAQANINLGTFENELFPFPTVAEQKSIVEKLNQLSVESNKLETIYQQKLADLEELKKSILQKAFAGELTDKSIAS
jgi:type I restriction enzyme S subunit